MSPLARSTSAAVAALLLAGSLAGPLAAAPPAAAPSPAAAPGASSPAAGPGPAPAAPSTAAVLDKARAAAGKRGVFLGFHASWCVWCRALEKLTVLPATKAVFDRYYEVAWLTVDERTSRKSLENPGADEFRTLIGGDGVALPLYAVIDSKGSVVATSVRRGLDGKKENVGFPGTPVEIQDFIAIFRAGAPDLTDGEEKALVDGIVSLVKP
jgi:thiol:disulfide interchange protein